MKKLIILCAALWLPCALTAGNESRYQAHILQGGTFEVIGRYSENAIYWCGAGHFAFTRLGTSGNQPLYVLKGPSASRAVAGRTAVTFGLAPPEQGERTGGWSLDVVPGTSMRVNQARGYCTDRSASDG